MPASDGWPSVSVVIPTRGRRESLRRAVASVMDQRYPGSLECLVVFDQERPERVEFDDSPDRRLRVLENDRTPGPAGARNAAAFMAEGELLAFCDDDDEWLPWKSRLQVEALARYPGSTTTVSGIIVEHEDHTAVRLPKRELISKDDLIRSRSAELHLSSVVTRRAFFLEEAGPFDERAPAGYGEDYDWLLRAAREVPLVAIRQPLVRIHRGHPRFAGRWRTIIEGIDYQLEKHPELRSHRRNLARMYGRLAIAHGALGERSKAMRWAFRAIGKDCRQPRSYLALLMTARLLPPQALASVLARAGKEL